MARQIYRKEALERLASPEQLDRLLALTSPRGWVALAALGLLLVMGLVWGLAGTVATTVPGEGALLRRGGVRAADAPAAGTLVRHLVKVGETVARGQEVAEVLPAGAGKRGPVRVASPCAGRVLEQSAAAGERVEAGAALALVDPADEPLRAVLYVPAAEGYQVRPGMRALVAPAPAPPGEFGYLVGTVESAARLPAGPARMLQVLASEEAVRQVAARGPTLEVVVALTPDAGEPGGFRWSSSHGWPRPLDSGTPCRGHVTVREQRPIALVLPSLGDLLGL